MLLVGALRSDAAGRIVLVRGTASAPDARERNYADGVVRRLANWLQETGVSCTTIDDNDLAARPRGTRLMILTYNPHPPAGQMALLKSFVGDGGKLIVFYSAGPELARLMNMRLGKYMASPLGGRWAEIRFNARAPTHVPAIVRQESRNIRPVYPAGDDARVIASWASGPDADAGEPAWVWSDRGMWMSHVLLDNGDTWRKKQMLLALIAVYEPWVWRVAAEKSVKSLCTTLGSTSDGIRGDDGPASDAALLARVEAMRASLPALLAQSRYAQALFEARRAAELVLEAYARVQKSSAGEFRAVWDHSGVGLYPGDWDRTCRVLVRAGITDILSNVAWAGLAHYPSQVVPQSDLVRRRGDQLGQCVTAAHKAGLRIHVWKVCWNLANAPSPFVERMRVEKRLQVSDDGRSLKWLCPSNTENLKMEKDMIREMARNYTIDGIHLDYIRYPDSRACYCRGCRRNFEKTIRQRVSNWPQDVRQGLLNLRYRQWRAGQITRFVRDVKALLGKVRPGVRLSAAVYGKYPLCAASVGQDWGTWLRDDLVDFVCPMDYTTDTATFVSLVRLQMDVPASAGRVFPGIGVTAADSRLDAFEVIRQILALRGAGAQGFVLFDLNRVLEHEILPSLSLGITRPEH